MFKAEWLNAGEKVLIRGSCLFKHRREERRFFIRHIHNYTEYNQQWNLCSAFNPSKCTHTRSSVKPTGSSWGFGALLKGLTSVVVLKVERTLVIHSLLPILFLKEVSYVQQGWIIFYNIKNIYFFIYTALQIYILPLLINLMHPSWIKVLIS